MVLTVAVGGSGIAAALATDIGRRPVSPTTPGAAGAALSPPAPSVLPMAPSATAPTALAAAPPPPPPPVAALQRRIDAHVLVVGATRFSPELVRRIVAATGARATLAVATGRVNLGSGQTTALGVDPSTFRAWTSAGTAESDPLWRSVASGDGSVAHVVARAYGVTLGGTVDAVTGVVTVPLRVGSFATTGLPGVGLVVDATRSRQLGLVPGGGLLLSVPQRDPQVSAAFAAAVVKDRAVVSAVQADRAAVGRWVVPTIGRVTSLFGPRVAPRPGASTFHEGLDIGAPIGTPVYAMSDGVVLYAGPAAGFGQEVVLSHRGGVTTVYGHVSRILVQSGRVAVGQPIALVGDEGESTGPHLHVEVCVEDHPTDPLAWLRGHGVRIG